MRFKLFALSGSLFSDTSVGLPKVGPPNRWIGHDLVECALGDQAPEIHHQNPIDHV